MAKGSKVTGAKPLGRRKMTVSHKAKRPNPAPPMPTPPSKKKAAAENSYRTSSAMEDDDDMTI